MWHTLLLPWNILNEPTLSPLMQGLKKQGSFKEGDLKRDALLFIMVQKAFYIVYEHYDVLRDRYKHVIIYASPISANVTLYSVFILNH